MGWTDNLVKFDNAGTAGKKHNILVTGASGYIGSHICKEFKDAGHTVVALDRNNNVLHNHYDIVVQGDYSDEITVQTILLQNEIDVVVHIAATSLVGPSVSDPGAYYLNNVEGTRSLLEACRIQGVDKFVFASSAATYGNAAGVCHPSSTELPCNPYGWTKWMTEKMLKDYHVAYGIKSVSLRYFNVAGSAHNMGQVKDATHLVARIIESSLDNKEFTVYGNTYPTVDGTCIRDYVHVSDVARANKLALDLIDFYDDAFVFNIGSSDGNSVFDIIGAVREYTPLQVKFSVGDIRDGDPAVLVSDTKDTANILGWKPKLGIDKIVKSAYTWYISEKYKNLSK